MTQGKTHREPLLRIAKRDGIARPKAWAIRIIAVLLSYRQYLFFRFL